MLKNQARTYLPPNSQSMQKTIEGVYPPSTTAQQTRQKPSHSPEKPQTKPKQTRSHQH